jgi:quercetin dioxygenase-like cupin family protein
MTMVAMRKGARMMKHHVDGQASVLALRGRVVLESESGSVSLAPGGVAVFDRGVEHDAIARTDCAFLITMSWSRR